MSPLGGLLWGALTNLTQTFVRCQEPFEGPQTPFNQQKLITHMFDKGLVDSCFFVITMGAIASVCLCVFVCVRREGRRGN